MSIAISSVPVHAIKLKGVHLLMGYAHISVDVQPIRGAPTHSVNQSPKIAYQMGINVSRNQNVQCIKVKFHA